MAKRGSLKYHGADGITRAIKRIERLDRERHDLFVQLKETLRILESAPSAGTAITLISAGGLSFRKKGGRRKGFKMSEEGRAKISAAQKKRWAKRKAGK